MRACLVVWCLATVGASRYDPHLPAGSPWFEDWYTRIFETTSGLTIGAIVGHYPDAAQLKDPAAYLALIIDDGNGEPVVFEVYPKAIAVRAQGEQVKKDPDFQSQPNFTVSFVDRVASLELVQMGTNQNLKMHFFESGVTFEATFSEPEPWGPRGEGPEGWAGKLPFLGLHWFVYSLHSRASFTLTRPSQGTITDEGFAHQEKNWGTAFPESWIWAQATHGEAGRLALAGGPAPTGPFTVPDAYLVTYRSSKLSWNFHPQDPARFIPRIDACAGTFELTAASAMRLLKISMRIDPRPEVGLFNVAGPTRTGFKSDSVENYRTFIVVEAYSGLLHKHLEERAEFSSGALEFGSDARCKQNSSHVVVGPVASSVSPKAADIINLAVAPQAPQHVVVRRVRRELRSLTSEERERVFAAMDVLKQTPQAEGEARYGPRFVSYDVLVAHHLKASAVKKGCDEAHLGPAFAMYHRAFTLRFEEALLAVDPAIGALPYWDYNIEAQLEDPRQSEIWKWFGSSEGDSSDGHAVKDGRFSHWRVRSRASDISNYTNSFGYLRSPWNVNPSPYITRNRYSCGSQTTFKESMWELCLKSPFYVGWYACIDPTVHTWAHSFIGGVWDTERNVSRVECFLTNSMGIPSMWANGCLDCDRNCTGQATAHISCSCKRSSKMRCLIGSSLARHAPTYGDFADAWSSPNDPIFFFHHANVDRHLMTWQQRHHDQAPYYGFPEPSIPCKGHGRHDVLAPDDPFDRSLLGLVGHGPLTNADLIEADGLSITSPYTYDGSISVLV